MDHDERWLRIGTFSTLSRISVRMLRHYQEHGVLEPALVDPATGHRRYRPEQLAQAHLAVALRDAGFGVAAIARLLDPSTDPAGITDAVSDHRAALLRRHEETAQQLVALDRIRTVLEGPTPMIEVTRTTLPEMPVASLRRVLPGYADEGVLWQELMPLVARSGATVPADALVGATFHDADHRERDVDVEIWLQLDRLVPSLAPAEIRLRPAQDVVTARLHGGYDGVPAVTAAIGTHLAQHGLTAGTMVNLYRVGPAQNPDPEAWVTDVCVAVES